MSDHQQNSGQSVVYLYLQSALELLEQDSDFTVPALGNYVLIAV